MALGVSAQTSLWGVPIPTTTLTDDMLAENKNFNWTLYLQNKQKLLDIFDSFFFLFVKSRFNMSRFFNQQIIFIYSLKVHLQRKYSRVFRYLA